MALRTITLRGFKSIANLENFEMRNINLLIGANGSGKSNFLSAFKFLAKMAQGSLQNYVTKEGGPDVFLHGGRKRTQEMFFEVILAGESKYGNVANPIFVPFCRGGRWYFIPTRGNKIIIDREFFSHDVNISENWLVLSLNSEESDGSLGGMSPLGVYFNYLKNVRQYHFHDTGGFSPIKAMSNSSDNFRLKEDAGNISSYIYLLRRNHPHYYSRIVQTIRMTAPFFGDFVDRGNEQEHVSLEWFERGDADTIYNAHTLSDGTLRFICLTTLLLQPIELLPDTILIDEPELGLHPYAITLLAEMIKQVAETKQVVIATQSVELLNHFTPEDVVVADREEGATVLRRLDSNDLGEWLKSYSLGELWQKNVLGGRPV